MPYTWAAVSATDNFSMIGYTGQLKNCDNCHVSNTVNFGASGAALQPSLLWSTTATGSFANPPTGSAVYRNSPYIVPGTNYGNNFSYTPEGATVAEYRSPTEPRSRHMWPAPAGRPFLPTRRRW